MSEGRKSHLVVDSDAVRTICLCACQAVRPGNAQKTFDRRFGRRRELFDGRVLMKHIAFVVRKTVSCRRVLM